MRPERLPDSVDEKLHAAAARADVHVEMLAIGEQFAEFSQDSPTPSLVELLRADELEGLFASRAAHRVLVGHRKEIRSMGPAGSELNFPAARMSIHNVGTGRSMSGIRERTGMEIRAA